MTIQAFFSINSVMFTIWDYPMSYIEFFGTVFNLACVWLAAKNKISTWPIGLVGVVLYIFLFYQIQLYSDLLEQFYFLVMSFYGWWAWAVLRKRAQDKKTDIVKNSLKENILWVTGIVLATWGLGYFMSNIHLILPKYFVEPASLPYLDALTTTMSFAATILMARKKVECWYLWVIVDVIGVGLYYYKGVKFISLEYVIFLVIATKGLIDWVKQYNLTKKTYEKTNQGADHREVHATT